MHRAVHVEHGPIEEVRAGLDWLSVSLHKDAPHHFTWANETTAVLADIADEGYEVRPFGLNGYRGILVGGSFAGRRDDGAYCQLAGAQAQKHFQRIVRPDLSVSRIDLAVTVRFVTMPRELGQKQYHLAVKTAGTLPSERRRKVWYMEGNDGGYTLYIGSPSSEQRGRLYNKEVQAGTPEYDRCWRYEVAFRNRLADQVWSAVALSPVVFVPQISAGIVQEWYTKRGIDCPWAGADERAFAPVERRPPSDYQRKLDWLKRQVRPAIRSLLEGGYRDEVLSMLGLGE